MKFKCVVFNNLFLLAIPFSIIESILLLNFHMLHYTLYVPTHLMEDNILYTALKSLFLITKSFLSPLFCCTLFLNLTKDNDFNMGSIFAVLLFSEVFHIWCLKSPIKIGILWNFSRYTYLHQVFSVSAVFFPPKFVNIELACSI